MSHGSQLRERLLSQPFPLGKNACLEGQKTDLTTRGGKGGLRHSWTDFPGRPPGLRTQLPLWDAGRLLVRGFGLRVSVMTITGPEAGAGLGGHGSPHRARVRGLLERSARTPGPDLGGAQTTWALFAHGHLQVSIKRFSN